MSQDRPTLGERLASRLCSRSRRRPSMAMDASFYARFGLADPWTSPEIEAEAESGDGMVFLSGKPFYAMMRRLAASRRRRERRQERFFKRRAGTTMRAASRRWAGEAEGVVPTFRIPAPSADGFILPAPVGVATETVEAESAPLARAPYQAMRPVKSAWYTTPFVPARVNRGGPRAEGPAALSTRPAPAGSRAVASARPVERVADRMRAATVETATQVRVAAQLPARVRRAIATVFVDELPADLPIIEVVRLLRRAGAPASVIREVIEVAPEVAATAVAARRMPANPAVTRGAGLRPTLARSPAMALASSADADHAASGTLAEAERSDVRTGSERPRRTLSRPAARASARGAMPAASAALSASPVARVSAGRPAALRAAPVQIASEGPGPSEPSRRPARVTRLVGQTFLPRTRAVDALATEAHEAPAEAAPVRRASAHAMNRTVTTAAPAPARSIARSDGAAWAFVRHEASEIAETRSVIPSAVPALRRPSGARTSAARPVLATPQRFVTARLAAATGTLTATGAPSAAPTARPVRRRVTRATAPAQDRAATGLILPAAGATPVQQALGRMAVEDAPATGPTGSVVRHATPRLDRPVRRAQVVAEDGLVAVQPESAPAATVAAPQRRIAAAKPAPRTTEIAGRQSPSRTALRRIDSPRVSTTRIALESAPSFAAEGTPAATGPMAWAPMARHARSVVQRAPVARRTTRSAPALIGIDRAELPASTPVREPAGRYVAARNVRAEGPVSAPAQRGVARTAQPGVARFVIGAGGRVNVVYVLAETAGTTPAVDTASVAGAPAPARISAVRSLTWASARTNVSAATAYRGAIADGGLPTPQRMTIDGFDPGIRANRTVSTVAGIASLALPGAPDRTEAQPTATARPGQRAPVRTTTERPTRPARTASASPARRAPALPADAFVAPTTFGFDGPDLVAPAASTGPTADAAPIRPASRRTPLDRRLHGMATGGAASDTPSATGSSPVWTTRSDGAPRVRSVHGLFESLARATTAEQVVHVLFARADGLLGAPAAIAAPIQQVISEIRQEVSRAPTEAASSDDAALPTRPSRLSAPQARPLRPQGGGSRPVSSTRVSRGTVRPVVSRARSVGSGSEDRIMGLVKKLQGLIHLAEQEHRLAEAQRQVRMAEDSHEARGEGGQGTRGPGQAGNGQDGSKMDIEQLGREVLDVVSRELEFRRERRMEDHDESIWW